MTDSESYHCPYESCPYEQTNGTKCFKKKLFLDQHIANIHAEKQFTCEKCGKKYGLDWQLKYHIKSCGVSWKCLTCDKTYDERLSLVVHCKRHKHQLPDNAKRKPKNGHEKPSSSSLPPIINVIVMQPTIFVQAKKDRILLPKANESPDKRVDALTQTDASQSIIKCKCDAEVNERIQENFKNKGNKKTTATEYATSKGTQTSRNWCRSMTQMTQHESRAAQCPPIKTRKRKKIGACECAQTQTLESSLLIDVNAKDFGRKSNACASTSTTTSSTTTSNPPKRVKKSIDRVQTNHETQTEREEAASASESTKLRIEIASDVQIDGDSMLMSYTNPLLSEPIDMIYQRNSCVQSVQTEKLSLPIHNIETQTNNIDIDATHLLQFDDDLFNDLELTDIETQTIWNIDGTTQTEDDQEDAELDDVIKTFFSSEATLFADTQTQTNQNNLSDLICSVDEQNND